MCCVLVCAHVCVCVCVSVSVRACNHAVILTAIAHEDFYISSRSLVTSEVATGHEGEKYISRKE